MRRRKFIKATAFTVGSLVAGNNVNFDRGIVSTTFRHGVASGDPLSSQVIIWTRITTDKTSDLTVSWLISIDSELKKIIQSGTVTTTKEIDYTVKVDVTNLSAATKYYYQFSFGEDKSPIGRTKTTSSSDEENLVFAVVSCSDYSAGYYNALRRISERKELDAVIHLGDYIYEGTARKFDNTSGDDEYESTHFNRTNAWWLHYYRMRYSINRLDVDLQAAHQAHAFITVWDDHEIANNAWQHGAQGHEEERDGDWEARKSLAKQVYAEWMPIRGAADKVYRTIQFGKLAKLILLDTRLEGRNKQISDYSDPKLLASDRTLLGKNQKEWFLREIDSSTSVWTIIASQVIFSEFNVQWSSRLANETKLLQETLLDYWEGYPAERDEIISYLQKSKKHNVVMLSASMHCALAFDVTKRASQYSRDGEASTYDPVTGSGSVAVEFAVPSITSSNFDEIIGSFYANTFQSLINKKLPPPLNYNPNPHLKFADLQRHGYLILRLTRQNAEGSFYFLQELYKHSTAETLGAAWHTRPGQNKLQKTV